MKAAQLGFNGTRKCPNYVIIEVSSNFISLTRRQVSCNVVISNSFITKVTQIHPDVFIDFISCIFFICRYFFFSD